MSYTSFERLRRPLFPQRCGRIFLLINSYTHLSKSYLLRKYDSRIREKRKRGKLKVTAELVRLPQRCDRIFTLIDSYTHLSKSYLHSKYDSRIRGKRKGERLTFKTAHAAPTIKNYPSRRLTSSSIFKKAFYFAKLRKLHLRSNAIWKVAVCIFLL